jgi:hypothetical protein
MGIQPAAQLVAGGPLTQERTMPRLNPKPPIPTLLSPDQVYSAEVTAQILNISIATLRRMWADGQGPRSRRLSPRRLGVRGRDLLAYLDAA